MGIENLLAQGYQPTRIEPYGNALMRAQQYKAAQQQNALAQMQGEDMHAQRALALQQAKQAAEQQAQQAAWRRSLPQPQGDPRLQALRGGVDVGAVSPVDFLKEAYPQQAPAKTHVVGGALVEHGPGGVKELYKTAEKEPEEVRLLKQVYGDGTPEFKNALRMLATKKTTHAPAVSVNVGAEKALAAGLGKQAAEAVDKSAGDAQAAQGTQAIIGNIRAAMSKGSVLLGPGAQLRQGAMRVGQILGAGSKDSAEALARTKEVEQGLAGLELEAAALMRGQGQITESERVIIRKAAAGQIQDLTPKELDVALGAIERNAQRKIKAHEQRIKSLPDGAAPGMRDLLSPAPSTPGAVNWGDLK